MKEVKSCDEGDFEPSKEDLMLEINFELGFMATICF